MENTVLALAAAMLAYLLWRMLSASGKSQVATYVLAFIAVSLTISMVLYPEDAFKSAVNGLKIWWDIVFPALLPFFIGSEILMGLGVVHFMGVLMEPFMRPVFNLPGVGSFVMAMGLASGYPIGAILTARMRQQNLVTVAEGERLMSTANTADPLFMAGAVAVGMFGKVELGGVIMAAHYLAALAVGVMLRFYKPFAPQSPPVDTGRENIILRAFRTLYRARREDGRPLGRLLGDSVQRSVNTLLLIGGFIILFSVIIRILTMAGVVGAISSALMGILSPLGVHPGTSQAMVSGLFEITIGTKLSSQAPAPLIQQVIMASAIIGWSGMSVHAQVAALTQGTGMAMAPYILARALHAFLAGAITYWLMGPGKAALGPFLGRLSIPFAPALPALAAPGPALTTAPLAGWPTLWLATLRFYATAFALVGTGLPLAALVYQLARAARAARVHLYRW